MKFAILSNSKFSYLFVLAFPIWFIVTGWSLRDIVVPPTDSKNRDYSINSSMAREVLTSQQLFVVGISRKKVVKDSVQISAELRDAFKIITYSNDSSSVVVDWTMCSKGGCPLVGVFKYGSAEYNALDKLIAKHRKK